MWVVVDPPEAGGELEDVALELVGQARKLADRLGRPAAAVLLGDGVCDLAPRLGHYGADFVYLAESPLLRTYNPDAYVPPLAELIRSQQPSIVLWAATDQGADLAPRVAARLGVGLASRCTRVDLNEDGLLVMTRPVYGGKASCNVVCPRARPQMATLQAGAASAARPDLARQGQVIPVEVDLSSQDLRLQVEKVIKVHPSALDLTEAEIIVAGGRGVGNEEGFHLVEHLAHFLDAAVAASRPAVDAGWVPYQRQVGLSGKTVAPRLYIACGISGSTHHVMGMKDSRAVVAINQDRHAPIFQIADLKVVADLRKVLPPLIARLRRLREEKGTAEDEVPSEAGWPAREAVGSLKVVVCVARVVDTSEPLLVSWGRAALDEEGLSHVLNAADEHALEESLRLKDRSPNSRVTAVSMGPPENEAVLRRCLALGADEVALLWDEAFRRSDTLATARILAAAIREMGADLVLCGRRASDGDTGQVGAQLAELLDIPAVTSVLRLEVGDGQALVHRRLERGRRAIIRCPLPALFAVEEGINRPRYPRLRDRLLSEAAEVSHRGLADLGLRPDEVGEVGSCAQVVSLSPPKPITKGLFVPDSSLSAEERWQAIISGGLSERAGDVIEGPPEGVADRLLQFLTQNKFI